MSNLETIENQEFNNQFSFLTTCLGRTKNLYSLFEVEIKDDNFDYSIKFKNSLEKINTFYEECLNILFNSQENFKTDINIFYELAPSYEEYSTVYSTIATQIALMCTSIGKFYESKNVDLINEISMNFEEIINIVKSEEFNIQNQEGDSWDYVEAFLEKEYADQREIIKEIDNQNLSKEQFQRLMDEYEIKF